MPGHFRGIEKLPFPYLKRAKEVIRFISFEFLNSHTSLKTVNGKDIIVLPIPATEGSSKSLLDELRDYIVQAFRLHISRDLGLHSDNGLGNFSETEKSRLGHTFWKVTRTVFLRILADEEGVRKVDREMTRGSETSYLPFVKEFGDQTYPILAEKWQCILDTGVPTYQQNGDLSIDEIDDSDDDVDIEAIDSLNKINISVFEEQPENLTNGRPNANDILALRKCRSWVTVETDKYRDIQTPDVSSLVAPSFILLAKGMHLTRKAELVEKAPAKDPKGRSGRPQPAGLINNPEPSINASVQPSHVSKKVKLTEKAPAKGRGGRPQSASLIENLEPSINASMRLSDSFNSEGRQTIEEFIRDAVARRGSGKDNRDLKTGKLVLFDHLFVRLTA